MARGKLRVRRLAFWKDDKGFVAGFGVYSFKASEARIYENTSEVRKAQKAFIALKEDGLSIVEFPEITVTKTKPKTDNSAA